MKADVHDFPLRSRRRWPWIAGGVVVLLALWANVAVGRLLDARDLARDGVAQLESVRGRVTLDSVADGDLTGDLRSAAATFATSHRRVRSLSVAPLRLVPWVGRQVRSADALSEAAETAAAALAEAAADVSVLADGTSEKNRVSVAREALSIVRRTQASLTGLDLGPEGGLTRALADARSRFTGELEAATELLDEVEVAAAGLAELLEGPSTYLLLAANNSEMRFGSGSYLQAGRMTVTDGRLEVQDLRSTGEMLLGRGLVEIPDADLEALWGWLDIAVDWRNLSASPRFPANAELAAAMWEALNGETVDGVIVMDPVALAAVMGSTGPVEVDGRSIEASGVVRELLFDQYWEDDVDVRRDRLEEVAAAALRTLDERGTDLLTLAKGLQDAAAGRHLLAWSPLESQQAAWRTLGIDGALESDSLMVGVLNRGANKLDSFLTIEANLEVAPAGPDRVLTLTLTLSNSAQRGFPPYVLGPAAALGHDPGDYVGILAVHLPGAARGVAFEGDDPVVASGEDGSGRVIAIDIEVGPGERLERRLAFELPGTRLQIEPSARVPAVAWDALGASWVDAGTAVIDLAAGTVSGEVLARDIQPIAFEPDPLSNPVAPIPFMRVDGDDETTVIVSWQELAGDPPIDLWERPAGGEWARVASAVESPGVVLPGHERRVEYCYRTALQSAPQQFSASECIEIPAALGFIRFSADAADYFSAPDFVGSGDLDVRVLVAPDRWTPGLWQMFLGQYDSAANDRSWRFGIDVFTALVGNFSEDGFVDLGANREIPVWFGDGRPQWVRMTIEPSRGRQRFWSSNGGTVWRQIGEDRTFDPIPALHDSAGPVYIGTDRGGSDNPFSGKLYYVEIREGVNGGVIANLDFRTAAQLDPATGRWTDDHGNVFRPHGEGWEYVAPEG